MIYQLGGSGIPIHIAVNVCEKFGQFDGQRLEAIAELIELFHDDRCRRHVAAADALAQVPDCDARSLQITDLGDSIFRIID